LTDGGYINPKNVPKNDSDIGAVETAIKLLELFKLEAEKLE